MAWVTPRARSLAIRHRPTRTAWLAPTSAMPWRPSGHRTPTAAWTTPLTRTWITPTTPARTRSTTTGTTRATRAGTTWPSRARQGRESGPERDNGSVRDGGSAREAGARDNGNSREDGSAWEGSARSSRPARESGSGRDIPGPARDSGPDRPEDFGPDPLGSPGGRETADFLAAPPPNSSILTTAPRQEARTARPANVGTETIAAELAGWAAGELPGQASARLAAWAAIGGVPAPGYRGTRGADRGPAGVATERVR